MSSTLHVAGALSGTRPVLSCCLLLLCFPLGGVAADAQEPPPEAPPVFGLGWLDQTQAAASNSANNLAIRMDRFFGVQRSDIEAAYSSLRLTSIQYWDRVDHYENSMRLRGRLYLPRIDERISLIFADENDDDTEYTQNQTSLTRDDKTRVNLEVNFAGNEAHRLFFRVGARSGPHARVALRYRYEPVEEHRTIGRFTQSLHYESSEGYGSFSRFQVDHRLNDTSLLRWTNDLHLEEAYSGTEYTTALEYLTLRSNKTALSWYGRINGETRPDFIVSYDLGMRYRKNIYREWLYLELEPGMTWRKEGWQLPRETSPYIFLRLEMAIGSYNR